MHNLISKIKSCFSINKSKSYWDKRIFQGRERELNKLIDYGAEFFNLDDGLYIRIGTFVFNITSSSDLLILNEVIIEEHYGFMMPTKEQCVVFDIGANTGIASNYFLSKSCVQKIYSFEPVIETYNILRKNLNINYPQDRYIAYNFGLYDNDINMEYLYDSNNKGSFGEVGQKKFYKKGIKENRCVELRETFSLLTNSEFVVPNRYKWIVKIDCEGAESKIIPQIMRLTRLPDLLLIEWHLNTFDIVTSELTMKGYHLITNRSNKNAGMIYAFKS